MGNKDRQLKEGERKKDRKERDGERKGKRKKGRKEKTKERARERKRAGAKTDSWAVSVGVVRFRDLVLTEPASQPDPSPDVSAVRTHVRRLSGAHCSRVLARVRSVILRVRVTLMLMLSPLLGVRSVSVRMRGMLRRVRTTTKTKSKTRKKTKTNNKKNCK